MEDKFVKWAAELQSLAQAGLTYGKDKFDLERYERIREISAEMMEEKTGLPLEKVKELFCGETGYQTPKVDTRAAVFRDGKILLVHENNGKWSLPGGWCDFDKSIGENTAKETLEEAGAAVKPEMLIAVQDRGYLPVRAVEGYGWTDIGPLSNKGQITGKFGIEVVVGLRVFQFPSFEPVHVPIRIDQVGIDDGEALRDLYRPAGLTAYTATVRIECYHDTVCAIAVTGLYGQFKAVIQVESPVAFQVLAASA